MNANSRNPENAGREAILDEIHTLLQSPGTIDEARAKRVRKASEALHNGADPAAGESPAAAANPRDEELDAKIDAALETLRARVHRQVERRNRDYEKALQLMDELEKTLDANELHPAEQAYHKLMSIMGSIPGLSEKRWQKIEKRLNRVRPRIRKLESWRHFGTTQARRNLIDQVQQLKEANLPPEKLAKTIQQARDQWRDWDQTGDHASKELWEEFNQSCEAAYQPCIAYFEKQKKHRAENLAKRRAVIDELNARFEAIDWKQPDWRAIDKYVKQARGRFYKIGNVEFKHRKPLAKALDKALEQYEPYLSRERERSYLARDKLVSDMEALADVANLREAIDRLEALKKQWVVTVASKRTGENKLWKRFQGACDAVYRRRDAEREQQADEREANLKQKLALIGELEQAAAGPDEALLANASALARIREQWDTIGWVPRKQEKNLERRWKDAQKQFRKARQAAQARTQTMELDRLADLAARCSQWELAALTGEAIDRDAVASNWDALPKPNGAMAGAIQRRYERALDRPDDATLAANLAAKKAACLKLEVLLELESPGDCQAERMAYQVERLNASMHKDPQSQDSAEDLLLTALTTGAVPADAAGAIRARIDACLAHYKNHL